MRRQIGRGLALVAIFSAYSGVALAATDAFPARMARVVGRVVDGTTRQPVTAFEIRIETPIRTHVYGDPAHHTFASSGHFAGSVRVKDPNGRFALTFNAEPVALSFVADGHATAKVGPISLRPGVVQEIPEVQLGPAFMLEGRVVDSGGSPLEGVSVKVIGPAGDPAGRAERVPLFEGKSAADGSFRVGDLDFGGIQLSIGRRGYIPQGPIIVMSGSRRIPDIVLSRAATLRGLVVDDRGEPVAHAAVHAAPETLHLDGSGIPEQWLRAESDASGTFVLDSLLPEKYVITASKPGMTTRTVDVQPTEGKQVRFALAAAGSVSGHISAESPLLSGFAAHARAAGEEFVAPLHEDTFRFDALPPGKAEIWLEIRGPHAFLHSARVPVMVAAGQTSVCTVSLTDSVSGTLRFTPTGRPAVVHFTSSEAPTKAQIEIGPGETFHLAGLDPAKYDVEMIIAGVPLETSIDTRRAYRLDLDLRQLYSMKGEVIDGETGDPIFRGHATLRQMGGERIHFSDEDKPLGSTSFWNMPPGDYELTVHADHYRVRTVHFRAPEEIGKAAEVRMVRLPSPFTCASRGPIPAPLDSFGVKVLAAAVEAWIDAQDKPLRTPGFDPRRATCSQTSPKSLQPKRFMAKALTSGVYSER